MSGVSFEHGGQAYRLRLGVVALVAYAAKAGRPMVADMQRLKDFDSDICAPAILVDVFAAALSPQLSADAVAELIDDIGLSRAMALFTEAASQAFPKGDGENP